MSRRAGITGSETIEHSLPLRLPELKGRLVCGGC